MQDGGDPHCITTYRVRDHVGRAGDYELARARLPTRPPQMRIGAQPSNCHNNPVRHSLRCSGMVGGDVAPNLL